VETRKCGRCGAELKVIKKAYVPFLGRDFYYLEECENCKRIEQQAKADNLAIEAQRLLKESNIPKKYKDISFDNLKAFSPSHLNAINRCKSYCSIAKKAMNKGYGIYMYGREGSGKTTIMSCMIKELTSQGYSCYINNMVEIKTLLYDKGLTIDFLSTVDFLFLDDIGTERYIVGDGQDTWTNEKIYEFINKRNNDNRPTIFSSNLDYLKLVDRGLLTKTTDRIAEMSSRVLEIKMDKSLRLMSKEEMTELEVKGE